MTHFSFAGYGNCMNAFHYRIEIGFCFLVFLVFIMISCSNWYRDGASNTVEEKSSIFSLIRMR